jgi:carbonic anhydrase
MLHTRGHAAVCRRASLGRVTVRWTVIDVDALVARAEDYRGRYTPDRPVQPARRLAVVACMDSRLDVFAMLGLSVGDAHVVRNAGGVVTPDVVRSLVISQRRLGTRSVVLVHHTDCGLQLLTDDGFKNEIERDTGMRPDWAVESFRDPYEDVAQSMARLRTNPFLLHRDDMHGFVFDVHTGQLHRIPARQTAASP